MQLVLITFFIQKYIYIYIYIYICMILRIELKLSYIVLFLLIKSFTIKQKSCQKAFHYSLHDIAVPRSISIFFLHKSFLKSWNNTDELKELH